MNSNAQSTLARLLAKENIEVQHGNFRTAFFDVQNRVLGLPLWKDRGKDVYDLLVGHEVGHALFTPADGWHDSTTDIPGIPRSFVNVVEDVRIEKLVQRQYPGLISSFKRGYKVLEQEDFFQTADRDLSSYSLVDRINIKAKLRDLVEVDFSTEELPIVKQVMAVETWEDVLAACKALYDFMKEQQEDDRDVSQPDMAEASDDSDQNDSGEMELPDDPMESEEDREETETPEGMGNEPQDQPQSERQEQVAPESAGSKKIEEPKDIKVETDEAFRENESKLIEGDMVDGQRIFANGISREQAKEVIHSYAEVKEARQKNEEWLSPFNDDELQAIAKFNAEAKGVVNVMAKEFEMRKAAYRYQRAQTARSGSIDVNRLHSYKYNDDVFSRVTQLADAKSHGMVMFVDYSGSMATVIANVIRQVVTLADFCKKVNIPFEVYGFTTPRADYGNEKVYFGNVYHRHTSIFELISSKMKKRDFIEARSVLVNQAQAADSQHYGGHSYHMGEIEYLGGTPLNETILCAEHIIKDFQSQNGVQKTNVVFLTDGDGQAVRTFNSLADDDNYIPSSGRNGYAIKMNGKTVNVKDRLEMTKSLLSELKNIDGVTLTGFFVCERIWDFRGQVWRSADSYVSDNEMRELTKSYNKDKFIGLDNVQGYDKYFILKGNKLSVDNEELEVDGAATKGAITRAFKKHTASKKGNRVLATQFAKLVA